MVLRGDLSGGGPEPISAPRPHGKGIDIGSIPGDVGRMLSQPFLHAPTFLKQVGHEVVHFGQPVSEGPTAADRAASLRESRAAIVRGQHAPSFDVGAGAQALQHRYGLRMLPLLSLFGAATPAGRAELAAHPAAGLVDVATLAAPALKGTRLAELATPVRTAARAGGRAFRAAAPGTAEALETIARPIVSKLPSRAATFTYHELGTAERTAEREVLRAEGPLRPVLEPLQAPQRRELLQALQTGVRPRDERLGAAFDAYATRKVDLTETAVYRHMPVEMHGKLRDEVAARLRKPLERVHGSDAARRMVDAFRAGEANPLPEYAKAWRSLQRSYGDTLRREEARWGLARDPHLEEVFPREQARRLESARKAVEAGRIMPEAYEALVDKFTPGRFRPAMEPVEAAKAALRERLRFEPGFGRGAYRKALAEIEADLGYGTWRDLRDLGVNPTHVHRRAVLPGEQFRPGGKRVGGARPGVLKETGRLAEQYADDPVVMLGDEELSLVKQQVFGKVIGRLHERFGTDWDRAVQEASAEGWARPERYVRSRMRHVDSHGEISVARPGKTLMPREVAEALSQYLKRFDEPSFFDRLLGAWMVPILWLAPAFHINNVVTGSVLTSLETSPLALIRYSREALRMAREGTMDPRIPTGAVTVPMYRRVFNAAEAEANGRGLAHLLRRTGHNVVESSRKFNQVADGMYRSVVYLERRGKGLAKGLTKEAAEAEAVRAASNLMQNWDALSTIERRVFQRLFPFWGWKRTMYRYFLKYPADHPYRMAFLRWAAAPYLDQSEQQGLPEEFDDLIPVTARRGGKQWFFRSRGMNPFADFADLFSVRGFLSSLDPRVSTALEAIGVQPYLGGVPASTRDVEVDRRTGRLRARFRPDVLVDVVPQVAALMQAAGLARDVPKPPSDQSTAGWLEWLSRYGPKLRLPSVTERDVIRARSQLRRSQSIVESNRRRGQVRRGGGALRGELG